MRRTVQHGQWQPWLAEVPHLSNGLPWYTLPLSYKICAFSLSLLQEGEQADTSGQGSKAPKNPITGQRLEPVTDVKKEGYQAQQGVGQTNETSARIMGQLGAQEGGRSFGGEGSSEISAT